MKAILLCLGLMGLWLPSFGQSPASYLPKEHFGDTTKYWCKWARKQEQQLYLKAVESSAYPFHFRISNTSGTILDIWQQEKQFQGSLMIWVREVNETLGELQRVYSQQYNLTPSQAASIGQLIAESGIKELPSQELIQGWQSGFDGVEIIVQYIDNNLYHFKNYWTPSAQRGLVEALLVQDFSTKVFDLSNEALVRKNFESGIPFPCYTASGSTATCKILTAAEYWQHKREASRYLHKNKKKIN